MDLLNSIFGFVFGLIFSPFSKLAPIWGLLVISFLTGVIMLFVFKATSDQAGIKKAKNALKAHFLAIRLYRDDISLMMNTMKNLLTSNLAYMRKNLRPMLFLMVPVGIVLVQIGTRYEYRPLRVGESTIVSVQLDSQESAMLSGVKLDLPDGLSLEIPPVRIDQKREVNWRIRADKPGIYEILFSFNGQTVQKQLHVVDELIPVATGIAKDDLATALMNPGESSLSESSFAKAIGVTYPKRAFEFLGFSLHWIVAFFVFSLIAAFSLKGFLRVEV